MKQQFVVTHTFRQNEIVALLDSCVTNTPVVKLYAPKFAYLYSFVRTTCLRVRLLRACPIFFGLLYNWLSVGYEKFQFRERFAMMINDFLRTINRFYAVGWSKLFVMWTCLNVVWLVRVPVWTLLVLVKRMWLEGRVSTYPAGRLCVHVWRLVDLCCSVAVVVTG